MNTHTPGPWFQSHRKSVYGGYRTEVYTEDGEVVATIAWYPKQLNETTTTTYREPNARLIAAAPDLLEVLLKVIRFRRGDGDFDFSRLYGVELGLAQIEAWERIEDDAALAIAKARGES